MPEPVEAVVQKRIILLLDGTWNDAAQGVADTNIVRLRDRIAAYLAPNAGSPRRDKVTPASASQQTFVLDRRADDGAQNIVFYERGVGTGGFLDNFRGGAFGAGLARNIRRAYMFLARNYDDTDEVYIFGFSRGSYTARSLTGLLGTIGLLKAEACTVENESAIWSHYKNAARMQILRPDIAAQLRPPDAIRVKCIGVFDTVGALGVPVRAFWREDRDLYEFHDVGLSPICEHSLHAVAVDEHREPFEATLWRRERFGRKDFKAEQVWFAGAHGNVGGGYIDENGRKNQAELDDISLDWMIRRVCKISGNTFPISSPGIVHIKDDLYLAAQHEPRKGIYRVMPFVWRSLLNTPVSVVQMLERNVCYDRHSEPIGEAIHVSAIDLVGARSLH
jgi:Uncharacterized alpha/beta hydrolase domain (DUF2235)